MLWIIGGDALVQALANAFPATFFQTLDTQMHHVPWNGFHFYDLIFPLFLFLAGVTIPFSLVRRREAGEPLRPLYGKIALRTGLLVLLGCLYNGLLEFDFANMRYASVLGHIGIAWGLAAVLALHVRWRGLLLWTAGILLAYWAAMTLIPVPGHGAGVLTREGNLAAWIDRLLLPGRLCGGVFDPEGILCKFPATALALLGVLAGEWLRLARPSAGAVKSAGLAAAGLACLGAGWLWGRWFPINKAMWTSSFVLFAGGWSLLLLALFHWVIDVQGFRRWSFPFTVVGMNAITIYLGTKFVDFDHTAGLVFGGAAGLAGGRMQPVLLAAAVLLVEWGVLYVLYRKKMFLKV
jgi:predicted acyltransferase